jgi:hypothetical protein
MARKALISLGLTLLLLIAGCGTAVLNQTAERTGNVTVQIINDTPYTAAFTYGTWDAWDRSPPGPVQLQQLVLAANTSSAVATVSCARNFSVATEEFIQRATLIDAPNSVTNFNADAFDSVVHFSNVAPGSSGASLPLVGTATGIQRLLGVDYECGDQLIFTLVQDPDAPGGFRVDFSDLATPPE